MTTLKIGNLTLNTNVILSPMAGITDTAFRLICRDFGCKFAFTEMINATALNHKNKKTHKMLQTLADDHPLGVQIFGANPAHLRRAVQILEDLGGFKIIDFNAACPMRKVVKRGEGAALMKTPLVLGEITAELRKATRMPLSVKIRSGWDKSSINAPEIGRILEDCGCDAITVHGRTREQLYTGKVDYEVIREVKQAVRIPVFGSGDIFCAQDASKMSDKTGVDGVMAARGAIGNPWIFRNIEEYRKTGKVTPSPSVNEIARVMRRHLELLLAAETEKAAVVKMRAFIACYLSNFPGAKKLRTNLMQVKTRKEFLNALSGVS